MTAGKTEDRAETCTTLPLLSVIVCNHNYGHFLERCVGSILAQTYPAVECIVVDDASTDHSRSVLDAMTARPLPITILLNASNLGQTRSCIAGFAKARGDYVALVDADDELLPDYAAAHIRAHLQARDPVAFTSCDMLSRVGGRTVLGTCVSACFVERNSRPIAHDTLRPLTADLEPHVGGVPASRLRQANEDTIDWIWPPTSGSVYRACALRLLFNNEAIGKLQLATDAYLNFALNALSGSILIDGVYAIYNIHDGNNFTRMPLLANLKNYVAERDYGRFAAYCALEHIVRDLPVFARLAHSPMHLRRVLRTLARKANQGRFADRFESIYIKLLHWRWTRRLPSLLPARR